MKTEISPYKMQIEKEMGQTLIVSENAMMKDNPEGALGNFVADAVLAQARIFCKDTCQIDLCVLNNGGLRNPLPKGNITKKDVFQLMPFENEIVVLTLSGDVTKELFDFIAAKGGMPVSGARMKIKNQLSTEIMIGDKIFDATKSYTVVTSDYLANGGDNMFFFSKAERKFFLGKKIRDSLIEYMMNENKKGNVLNVKKDGRIKFEQ